MPMDDMFTEVGVETIDGGRVIHAVNHQIEKAVANCVDPNTAAKANRTVTLKITFQPDEKREKCDIGYEASVKLISDANGADSMSFGRDDKGYVQKGQLVFDEWQEQQEVVDPKSGEVTQIPRRLTGDNGVENG